MSDPKHFGDPSGTFADTKGRFTNPANPEPILPTTPPPPPPPDAWSKLPDAEREAVGDFLVGGKKLPSQVAITAALMRLGLR